MDGSGLDGSVTVTAGSYEQAFPRTISCHETHRDGAQVTQALGRLPVVMSAEQDVNLAAGVSVAVGECNEDSHPRSGGTTARAIGRCGISPLHRRGVADRLASRCLRTGSLWQPVPWPEHASSLARSLALSQSHKSRTVKDS